MQRNERNNCQKQCVLSLLLLLVVVEIIVVISGSPACDLFLLVA